jgi:hypothetical protein
LIEKRARIFAKHLENSEQGASLAPNETSAAPNKTGGAPNKKRAGRKPRSENCVDPIFPKIWI